MMALCNGEPLWWRTFAMADQNPVECLVIWFQFGTRWCQLLCLSASVCTSSTVVSVMCYSKLSYMYVYVHWCVRTCSLQFGCHVVWTPDRLLYTDIIVLCCTAQLSIDGCNTELFRQVCNLHRRVFHMSVHFYAFTTIGRRQRHWMFFGHLRSHCCPLTPISREMISLCLIEVFQWSLSQIIAPCEWALLKRFSRSEVKGQGHMCRNMWML